MKTLGSAPESRDPETRAVLEKDASSFLDDLARWTSELKASGADLEPTPVRPRSGPGVAPIRNVPAATVVARGPRDKKASDEKASSSAGASPPPPPPSDAAFAEATSRALGLDDGGAAASALRDFADSASKKDSDVVDLSVPGASNAEKTLAAMAGASASERKWVARREREKGNELFRAREYSSAVDAYALALALDPACVTARSNRAAANMKLRRWRDAIADCDAALAAEPEHVKALARRGESRLELHPGEGDANARAALADLEKAAAIEPGNEHVRALERRARKAVAETAPTRRVAIETEEEAKEEDGAALEKKTEEPKKPKAAERFEAAREGPMVIEEVEDEPAEDEPAEPRQVSESRRRVVIEEEESEESEESEDEAGASDERDARNSRDARKSAEKKESTPAWALEKEKGNAAFGRGDFHAARERYDAALALVPASDASASATLLANRAAARLKLGEYAAAESDASAALAKDPRYVKAYHRRACARRELGDFEGALEDYEEVVRADPTNERVQAEVEACMRGAAEKMLGGFGGEIGGGDAGARGGGGVAVPIQADSDDDTDEEEDAPEARRPAENASTPDAPPGTSRRRIAIVEEDSESEDERGEDAEDVSRRDADPPAARDPPGAAGDAVSASEATQSHSSATQSHSSAAIAKMSAELEATRLELEARKREVARAEETRARAKARADECAEELRAADAKKAEAAALVEASAEKARAEVEGPSAGHSGVSSDPASGSAAPLPSELRNVAESCKMRGNKLFKMGEHARAAEAYGEALAIDPANASYLANRAAAYLKLEAFRDALVDADSALATDPTHDRARHRRAAALFALGAFRDAAEEYDRVVAANPTHEGVKAEAERARARAREEEVREASARAEEGKAEAASEEKKAEKSEKAPPPPSVPPPSPPSVPSPPAPSPPSRKLRPAPRTATELERGLASLRGDADALLGFASLVPPADLPKLVRESVSPAMLGAYAEATARAAERANEDAKALAHALATAKALAGVPRFAANAMMMKRADKETMRAALERVGGEDAREIADAWKL